MPRETGAHAVEDCVTSGKTEELEMETFDLEPVDLKHREGKLSWKKASNSFLHRQKVHTLDVKWYK